MTIDYEIAGITLAIRPLTGAELDEIDAHPEWPIRRVAYMVCGRPAIAPLPHPQIRAVVDRILELTHGSEEQEKN